MSSIKFVPDEKHAVCKIGDNLLDAARRIGIEIIGPCGGKALCGKCIVKIVAGEGALNSPTDEEKLALSRKRISEGYRLSCRCEVIRYEDIVVYIPPETRASEYVLLVEGQLVRERHDPLLRDVKAVFSRRARKSIVENILTTYRNMNIVFSLQALRNISSLVQDFEKEATLVLHKKEVLDVKDDDNILGFAIDIGTTKLAGYLVDIPKGKILVTTSEINPQIVYGEDVVSRITYAINNGVGTLHRKIVDCINKMMEKACKSINLQVEDIYEIVAVGNSVMHHTLLGLDLKALAYFPYTPVIKEPIYLKASDLGFYANREAKLFLPPLVAGYIGSDVVADILAVEMHKVNSPSMLIDIGTNTEIVIGKDCRFFACSTASGPAFEGAHIKFGMRAAKGAIERVDISDYGDVRYTVIGGARPIGLTGSAVVDAIAGLHSSGILDYSGKLIKREDIKRLRVGEDGLLEFVIAYKDETAIGKDIVLTQKDVREVQLAKAAIKCGVSILMKKLGINEEDLDVIYVAGAFGFFLNPISAIRIGLLPKIDVGKIRIVGNTAGMGARAILLSEDMRKEAVELVERIEHVEVAAEPDFQKEFMASMNIPKD